MLERCAFADHVHPHNREEKCAMRTAQFTERWRRSGVRKETHALE
jgi:hypothetical protein